MVSIDFVLEKFEDNGSCIPKQRRLRPHVCSTGRNLLRVGSRADGEAAAAVYGGDSKLMRLPELRLCVSRGLSPSRFADLVSERSAAMATSIIHSLAWALDFLRPLALRPFILPHIPFSICCTCDVMDILRVSNTRAQ